MDAEKVALARIRAEQAPIVAKLRKLEKYFNERVLKESAAQEYGLKASQVFVQLARRRRLGGDNSGTY